MKLEPKVVPVAAVTAAVLLAACVGGGTLLLSTADAQAPAPSPPQYEVDAAWPAQLPNNWIMGQVAGIAVGRDDHVWIVQRPRSLTVQEAAAVQSPPTAECCVPAPSVIELDADGQFVQAWGGPTWNQQQSQWQAPAGDWPLTEHGIFVDADSNVWLAGNGETDHVVLKLRPDGTHLLTIGRVGETGGSNDTERLGRPADIAVDTEAREVYIADGYGNRRVIVFDSETGEYKRHWGAYGREPDDRELPAYVEGSEPAASFRAGNAANGAVHSVVLAEDGLVYVADRQSDRIQVFRRDGEFVSEALVAPWTLSTGSVWDLERSAFADDRWLFVADGHNKKVWILDRASLEVVGSFGHGGRQAGQFEWLHNIAADSQGNLYTAEVNTGKRVQKFRRIR